MVIEAIAAFCLVALGSVCLAYSHSASHRKFWPDDFWDMELSAKRKYKDGDPTKGPKFWGSTTFFIWLTDGWHFMNFLFNRCWQAAIAIFFEGWYSVIVFFSLGILFSGLFEQVYKRIKKPLFKGW